MQEIQGTSTVFCPLLPSGFNLSTKDTAQNTIGCSCQGDVILFGSNRSWVSINTNTYDATFYQVIHGQTQSTSEITPQKDIFTSPKNVTIVYPNIAEGLFIERFNEQDPKTKAFNYTWLVTMPKKYNPLGLALKIVPGAHLICARTISSSFTDLGVIQNLVTKKWETGYWSQGLFSQNNPKKITTGSKKIKGSPNEGIQITRSEETQTDLSITGNLDQACLNAQLELPDVLDLEAH